MLESSNQVFLDLSGKMLGLKTDTSITLSGEQIESMDTNDLESVIDDVRI